MRSSRFLSNRAQEQLNPLGYDIMIPEVDNNVTTNLSENMGNSSILDPSKNEAMVVSQIINVQDEPKENEKGEKERIGFAEEKNGSLKNMADDNNEKTIEKKSTSYVKKTMKSESNELGGSSMYFSDHKIPKSQDKIAENVCRMTREIKWIKVGSNSKNMRKTRAEVDYFDDFKSKNENRDKSNDPIDDQWFSSQMNLNQNHPNGDKNSNSNFFSLNLKFSGSFLNRNSLKRKQLIKSIFPNLGNPKIPKPNTRNEEGRKLLNLSKSVVRQEKSVVK